MRIYAGITVVIAMFAITATIYAQDTWDKSPAIDFFMHGRMYDTFLRDYYRLKEPKPLRIEYWYVNWLDSGENAGEYRDYLHLETVFPLYSSEKIMADIPFQYSLRPIWGEKEDVGFGRSVNVLKLHPTIRWRLTDNLKSTIGWEYNLKGDGDTFSKASGREICLLKAVFSYDLHKQLNIAAGGRLDRYYYDTDEGSALKIADRLYSDPIAMVNWHPSSNFILLLGIPASGVHAAIGDILEAEGRVSLDKDAEIGLKVEPMDRTDITFRFMVIPYREIPIKGRKFGTDETLAERFYYTDKTISLEIGHELNPAAIAFLGIRYSFGGDLELKDRNYKSVIKLDSKPYLAIGASFTMGLEALTGAR